MNLFEKMKYRSTLKSLHSCRNMLSFEHAFSSESVFLGVFFCSLKIFLFLVLKHEFLMVLNFFFLFFVLFLFFLFIIKVDSVLNKRYLNFACLQADITLIIIGVTAFYTVFTAACIYKGVDTRSSSANTIWGPLGPPQWKVLYDPQNLRFYVPSYYQIMSPKGAVSPLAVTANMPNNLKPVEFWFYMHGRKGILAPCLG